MSGCCLEAAPTRQRVFSSGSVLLLCCDTRDKCGNNTSGLVALVLLTLA